WCRHCARAATTAARSWPSILRARQPRRSTPSPSGSRSSCAPRRSSAPSSASSRPIGGAVEVLARYKFEQLVVDALDDLPDELQSVLDNVVIQIHDRHPDEPDLLGLYEGTPHTERRGDESRDVISIYPPALRELCDDIDDLAA